MGAGSDSPGGSVQARVETDLALVVAAWDDAAEALFGWTEAEAVGRAFPHLTPGVEAPEVRTARRRLIDLGTWEGVATVRRRDGSPVAVHGRMSPAVDPRGGARHLFEFTPAGSPQIPRRSDRRKMSLFADATGQETAYMPNRGIPEGGPGVPPSAAMNATAEDHARADAAAERYRRLFGRRLRRARRTADLTQAQLAELAGVSQRDISRYEHGHHMPRAAHHAALADALGLPLAWFLTDEEEEG
jgi:PAS domain S-box-containing protein